MIRKATERARQKIEIEGIVEELKEMKNEALLDPAQFRTLSEVEEYVYKVINRKNKFGKDAKIEDVLAISLS